MLSVVTLGALFCEMVLPRVAVTVCVDFISCFTDYTRGVEEYAELYLAL